LKAEFKEFKKQAIHRAHWNIKSLNCDGNYITECKNCHTFYFGEDTQDCSYQFRASKNKDSYDGTGIFQSELCYQTCQIVHCYKTNFVVYTVRCAESEYLDQCEDCKDCFGCVGLRHKQFCILNKQYEEKEYYHLVTELKKKMKANGEYGNFFPYSMMYNGYNDTLASFYYPETKASILEKGGWWQDEDKKESSADLLAGDLPDHINQVNSEEILKKTVLCPQTGKIFRYIPQELKFYQANNIPLPRYYYNYRVIENFRELLPPWERGVSCAKCGQKTITYYPAEWDYQNIYCEECYQKEIY
jgi:hypothetical protein